MAEKPNDIEAIYNAALKKRSEAERSAYLDAVCGDDAVLRARVESLVKAHEEAGDFLEVPAVGPDVTVEESPSIEGPGTMIGRYELLELIGEGGMGLVYLAEQKEPVRRRVALKIIKPGMDSKQVIARFEAERQTLAVLDHPNIAHVFDAGTTKAGRPYFVMEYVEGVSITKYCDEQKLNIEERLELFKQVCEGVQHAHQKGIIHRDIKPSNILVSIRGDNAMPKIIDFGIAKAITQPLIEETFFTHEGQLLGTPEYMSPEQVDLATQDIDTRSDIYSLGVLLYVLLAGVLPFDRESLEKAGFSEIQRTIREEEPPLPSTRLTNLGKEAKVIAENRRTQIMTLTKRLHRELEWIPMKAMRKDRTRRYRSASELADDIQNYLSGAPLIAGPESTVYRARKFVRKHAGSVATAALVAVLIVLGLVVSTALSFRAENARKQEATARTQAEQAEEVADKQFKLAEKQRELAEEQRKLAEEQRKIAEERADKYRRLWYVHSVALADTSYRDGNMQRVRELLEVCPQDLRGWEWDHLNHISSDESCMTLNGHSDLVFGLAVSPDGKRIASGSFDKTVKVWDAEAGAELMTLRGHEDRVGPVSFSPDGRCIVSGSADNTIKVWDAATGAELMTFRGHKFGVSSVAFNSDGKRIVSSSPEGTIKVWDIATGEELISLRGHEGRQVLDAAFSPDGKRIVSSGRGDRTIKLWDASTGAELMTLRGHKGAVYSVAFSPDGKRIASGAYDKTIKVWDSKNGAELRTLRGHTGFVLSTSFSPDGHQIVSGGGNNIKVWDAQSGEEVMTLHGHEGVVLSVAFSPDGKRIISNSADKTIKIWDAIIDRENTVFGGRQVGVCPLAISPDGTRVVSTSGEMVQLWDVATGAEITTLRGHSAYIVSVSMSPDGRYITSASMDSTAKVWDTESGDEVMTLTGHEGGVGAAVFSPDCKQIATGSFDRTIKIWDAEDGTEVKTFRGHSDGVRSVAFSPDGERLASGGRDGTVRVWDVRTGRQMMLLRGDASSRVQAVAFNPDGTRIVSGSGKIVKVWNARTGDDLLTLRGHQELVYALAISPDGKRIVSGGRFGVVKVWDAATGAEVITLRHPGHGVAFSPDGKTIVAAAGTGIILCESDTPPDGYKSRRTGAMAQELVDKLHEEHGLYAKVIDELRANAILEGPVRKLAMQIANARLWKDE